MLDAYCTRQDILDGDIKLGTPGVPLDLDEIVSRATDFVRNDLAGTVDIETIDAGTAVPDQVKILATFKGKELAYIRYYGNNRPEQSEVEQSARDYDQRVRALLEKVRRAELDSVLVRPTGERKSFRFL